MGCPVRPSSSRMELSIPRQLNERAPITREPWSTVDATPPMCRSTTPTATSTSTRSETETSIDDRLSLPRNQIRQRLPGHARHLPARRMDQPARHRPEIDGHVLTEDEFDATVNKYLYAFEAFTQESGVTRLTVVGLDEDWATGPP